MNVQPAQTATRWFTDVRSPSVRHIQEKQELGVASERDYRRYFGK